MPKYKIENDKIEGENNIQSVANEESKTQKGYNTAQIVDNREETVKLKELQKQLINSQQTKEAVALQMELNKRKQAALQTDAINNSNKDGSNKKDKKAENPLDQLGEVYEGTNQIFAFLNDKNKLVGDGKYSNNTVAGEALKATGGVIGTVSDGLEINSNIEGIMDKEKIKNDYEEAVKSINGMVEGSKNPDDINAFQEYFTVFNSLEIFGVTKMLSSIADFMHAKKDYNKIGVLNKLKEKSRDPGHLFDTADFTDWALKKIKRSFITSIFRGVLKAVQAISRWTTIASGFVATPVTGVIETVSKALEASEGLYRKTKGIYKFFKGTKGIKRKANAEKLFNLVAIGDEPSKEFFKEFHEAGAGYISKVVLKEFFEQISNYGDNEISKESSFQEIFSFLNKNESDPKIKFYKKAVITHIANMFKSQPPAPTAAMLALLMSQEPIQDAIAVAGE